MITFLATFRHFSIPPRRVFAYIGYALAGLALVNLDAFTVLVFLRGLGVTSGGAPLSYLLSALLLFGCSRPLFRLAKSTT